MTSTRLVSPRALLAVVMLVAFAAAWQRYERAAPGDASGDRTDALARGHGRASRRVVTRTVSHLPEPAAVEMPFIATNEALVARPTSSGLEASIEADGAVRMRAGERVDVRMRLTHAGRGALPTEAPRGTRTVDGRAVVDRGAIQEWYVQAVEGLEQGFDLLERPLGEGTVVLTLGVEGARPTIAGSGAILVGDDGEAKLAYRDLVVTDSEGRELPASIRVHEHALALVIDDSEAAYPVRVDPFVSPMYATLTSLSSDLVSTMQCGHAVAIRNGLAAVGCPGMSGPNSEIGSGAVLLFQEVTQTGGVIAYTYLTKLYPSTPSQGARFGASLAFDGSRLVVGAPEEGGAVLTGVGHVYVFDRVSGTTFAESASLGPNDPSLTLLFGASVALDGDRVLVGAPGGSPGALTINTGTAYLFDLSLAPPSFVVEFAGPSGVSADGFGASVAIADPYILVGVPGREVGGIANAGAVVGFTLSTSGTPNAGTLVPNPTPIDGAGFGASVDISGVSGVVGCPRCSNVRGANVGSAMVYTVSGTGAIQVSTLIPPSGSSGDFFGRSVAIDGDAVVVGAPGAQLAANSTRIGAAYLFLAHGGDYIGASKYLPTDAVVGDAVGFSVDLDRNASRIILGLPGDGVSTVGQAGSARVFGLVEYSFVDVTVSGSGTGSVASTPDGILCPTDCTDVYADGTTLGLVATPAAGSYLASVSGDCSASPCYLTIGGDAVVDVVFELQKPNGEACADAIECVSGNCVDGVCCNSGCGDGAADCQACSVAEGGTTDGMCTPLAASIAATTVCHDSTGLCDPAETCDPGSTQCPADLLSTSGTVCRQGANAVCDPSEVCSGSSAECPADVIAQPNTPCDDQLFCNGIDLCDSNGQCVSRSAPQCVDDGDPCTVDLCVDPVGCISVRQPGCVVVDGGAVIIGDGGLNLDGSVDGSADGTIVPPQPNFQGEGGCACTVAGDERKTPFGLVFVVSGLVAAVLKRRRRR